MPAVLSSCIARAVPKSPPSTSPAVSFPPSLFPIEASEERRSARVRVTVGAVCILSLAKTRSNGWSSDELADRLAPESFPAKSWCRTKNDCWQGDK